MNHKKKNLLEEELEEDIEISDKKMMMIQRIMNKLKKYQLVEEQEENLTEDMEEMNDLIYFVKLIN